MELEVKTIEALKSTYPTLVKEAVEEAIAKLEQTKEITTLKQDVVSKDAEISKLDSKVKEVEGKVTEFEKQVAEKDKKIEELQKEADTVKGKLDVFMAKESMAVKEAEIDALFVEKKVPDQLKKSEAIRESLRAIKEEAQVEVNGEKKTLSIKDQMAKKIDEFLGILAKPAKVTNTGPKGDAGDEKINVDDFVRIAKKR